jgi:hypothetical protein
LEAVPEEDHDRVPHLSQNGLLADAAGSVSLFIPTNLSRVRRT